MLTEKDYCDRDTAVALQKLGYNNKYCRDDGTPVISLYEAQKWLREEKNIIVDVRYGAQYYNVVLRRRITGWYHIVKDKNNKIADFIEYEEALSEGIKEAIKILKENENT